MSVQNRQEAEKRAEDLKAVVGTLQAAGFDTVRSLAQELNKRGIQTAKKRVQARLKKRM